MSGAAKPRIGIMKAEAVLVTQGERSADVYLVLDGALRVEVDGEAVAEYGPGAMLRECAFLEGGTRTSSLVAVTQCRVAWAPAESFDRTSLEELSSGHGPEDPSAG